MSLGKKAATTDALRSAVLRATQYLEENIDRRVAVTELAHKAGVSPYHFQRVFREVVGETVEKHALRLRIERAAYYLKFSAWHIQEVALAAGFESQASFTRAFRRYYGKSPKQFREDEGVVPFLRSHMRSRKFKSDRPEEEHPIPTVRLETQPQVEAIALRYYGPVEGLHKPWAEMLKWARKNIPNLSQARFLGLWFDDWSHQDEANYRYECAILPDQPLASPPPAPFFSREISAGDLATATVRGNIMQLDRAWRALVYGWLPFSGYQPRLEFAYDEYPADLMLAPGLLKLLRGLTSISIDICLPVTSDTIET